MKIISGILYGIGIIFCVLGCLGHITAWAAAALLFFAATMILMNQKKEPKK